jgi:hypothetical protein
MHGVEVSLPQGGMAGTALIGNFRNELILVAQLYFMRGMAIPTGRQFFRGLAYHGAMDALGKFVINPPMAGAASSRKIFDVNGRLLILMG